jgi:hypothetical protein
MAFPGHLRGKVAELLNSEQAGAAMHKAVDPSVQLQTILLRDGGVAPRLQLGGQVEAGTLHSPGQNLAKHLKVKGQVSIQSGVAGLKLFKQ